MTAEACRRCLLFEYNPELALTVREYVSGLSEKQRASGDVYERRLQLCGSCDELNNGMCRLCGCFVEARAAKKLAHCAKSEEVW